MMKLRCLVIVLAIGLSACASTPPPHVENPVMIRYQDANTARQALQAVMAHFSKQGIDVVGFVFPGEVDDSTRSLFQSFRAVISIKEGYEYLEPPKRYVVVYKFTIAGDYGNFDCSLEETTLPSQGMSNSVGYGLTLLREDGEWRAHLTLRSVS